MGIHHYEHECEYSDIKANKYLDIFNKYDLPTEKAVSEKVKILLDKHYSENFNSEVLKKIHGLIDLTSLNSLDTKESIWEMVETKVNSYEGTHPDVENVAAICTYPLFVETVKQALTAQGVKIASVAGGFPSSQTFPEVKIAETALAVMSGADEIDIVMNLGYFWEEDYETLADEINEIKESCRNARLKVIIETGALNDVENIGKATILTCYSGADFVKTSTGKEYPGTTPEAVYAICRMLKKYNEMEGIRTGIKVSGGIRIAEDAVKYYTIVKETLGKDWLNKDLFRIGASHLVEEIRKRIKGN
ncbi:MAG: deoxyribose-phosphate aldolase [Tannerella sp.]|jgi:deoxyribose-phosphate aldolase|nr:deoxyribose-phosphate aldolase [Tannerella sp.]